MTPRAARTLIAGAVLALVWAVVLVITGPPAEDESSDLRTVAPVAAAPAATTPTEPPTVTEPAPDPSVAPTDAGPTSTEPYLGAVDPARLRIPAIGVDAPVVAVGLEPDGAMEIPGADQAGWYEPTGIWPGSPTGSAVVAAHVDYGGQRGVFFDLRSVPVGAEVWVADDHGNERRFIVDTRFQVHKDDLPASELFRTDGDPTLTLITCGGTFDGSERSYRDNIVLRARPA